MINTNDIQIRVETATPFQTATYAARRVVRPLNTELSRHTETLIARMIRELNEAKETK